MAQTTGASRYNQPVKYGKKLTLTMSDGTTKEVTGTLALRIQKFLEDNPRFIYITDDTDGSVEFYALSQNGCGFCKVAVYEPSATLTDPVVCENGMPNCPGDDLNPTTPSLALSSRYAEMEVGKTAKVTADVVPADDTVTWTSADATIATVANGVITGVKAGDTTITVKTTTGKQEQTIAVKVVAAGTFTDPITGGSTARP